MRQVYPESAYEGYESLHWFRLLPDVALRRPYVWPLTSDTATAETLTPDGYVFVELPPTAAAMLWDWNCTASCHDGLLSGVLADWLDDHRDELLAGVPQDAAAVYDLLVAFFRARFSNPRNSNAKDGRVSPVR